jgi:hypothetical protein
MKGKRTFTASEATQILRLLRSKEQAERGEQKQLRAQLRKRHGFYITDFPDTNRPFRAQDFNALVSSGRITLRG